MRAIAVIAAVLAVATTGAGCGGARQPSGASAVGHGRQIFARSCAACHTVAGRESGAVGGDLVNAHLSVADLASFAVVMPTPSRLSPSDAAAVASYIDSVASSLRKRGG